MQPRRGFDGRFDESIPEDVLPLDLIHRAVRRIYEGEGDEAPVAPNVRIINLSVCDPARPFAREISAGARLLDWLSWKYKVLFIVSAGNHYQDIEVDLPNSEFENQTSAQLETSVLRAIAADARNRRLLSPAETLNGLTVGAIHSDSSTPKSTLLVDPFKKDVAVPSILSSQGPGYRRSIKPEILLPGGRQLLSKRLDSANGRTRLQAFRNNSSPGQLVAAPGLEGEINGSLFTKGTSNAAALASRAAVLINQVLEEVQENSSREIPEEFMPILIKALLVHGADWGNALQLYESALKNPSNSRTFRDYAGHFLGYGPANIQRVLECTEQRATALGFGTLRDEEGAEFTMPLPSSLASVNTNRRLTITLAWLTPINCQSQKYRIAQLWFDPTNPIAGSRQNSDHNAVKRGTIQHEILQGSQAVPFYDDDVIGIKVNCRADGGKLEGSVDFGLAVTLEVAEEIDIPIYQEIRDRLAVRVPI